MKKGDLVLVSFPFTDFSARKNRPAVILFASDLDVVVAFITSQMKWAGDFTLTLIPSDLNGLKKESLLRLDKITTVDKASLIGKLGHLHPGDIVKMDDALRSMLGL